MQDENDTQDWAHQQECEHQRYLDVDDFNSEESTDERMA